MRSDDPNYKEHLQKRKERYKNDTEYKAVTLRRSQEYQKSKQSVAEVKRKQYNLRKGMKTPFNIIENGATLVFLIFM